VTWQFIGALGGTRGDRAGCCDPLDASSWRRGHLWSLGQVVVRWRFAGGVPGRPRCCTCVLYAAWLRLPGATGCWQVLQAVAVPIPNPAASFVNVSPLVPTPYAWFGIRPELFDAPSRGSKHDVAWEAYNFLCVSPDAVLTRHVQAIAYLETIVKSSSWSRAPRCAGFPLLM
jgi:hypothetical protein